MTFAFTKSTALAYETTRWTDFLFDQRVNAHDRLGRSVASVGHALTEFRAKGGSPDERGAAYDRLRADARTFGGEVFARLYDAPEKAEKATPWADKAHGILDEIPEWAGLRAATQADPDMAALATATVLDDLAGKLPGLLKAIDQSEEDGEPVPGRGVADGLGRDGQAMRAALRRAVAKATEKVGEAREALAGLAPGSENAPPAHEQEDASRLVLAEALLENPAFREVLRRAGKLRRIAESADKRRDPHGVGDVVGLERGADLGRILPGGLAALGNANPALRALVFKDLAERQMLQYRIEGKTTQGRGPILVLVDESGSMEGASWTWAKATVLAAMMQGRREKRRVAVAFFQRRITAAHEMNEQGSVTTLNPASPVPAEHAAPMTDSDLFLAIMRRGANGGTDFSQPLAWACDYLEAREDRADVIIVTDGNATCEPATAERLASRKASGSRLFGLTVGYGGFNPTMADLCDDVVAIDKVPESDLESRLAGSVPVRR